VVKTVKLSELKKLKTTQSKVEEVTIVDCMSGVENHICYAVEKRLPIIVPASIDGADELIEEIEDGKMVKAKVKMWLWPNKVEEIVESRVLSEDEIDVDDAFVVTPSVYGNMVAQGVFESEYKNKVVIIKPGTINYMRLLELYNNDINEVAMKLSGVRWRSEGKVKVVGVWLYPLEKK